MSAEELLPCPFCGGHPVTTEAMGEHWVSCGTCTASATMKGKLKEACDAWNRRTPPAMSADHIGEATNMVAPMEAVAWRWRLISEPGQTDMDWSYTSVEARARGWTNPDAWEVQALAVIPPQPDALPGDLRERVAGLINDWPFHTEGVRAAELADALLALIQTERA